MWDLSSEVKRWEERQLRILVLGSLFLQFVLFVGSITRHVRALKSFMWLAYISSDAIAIYALTTLLNRHKDNNHLEVLWAPVLLHHLGGLHTFTAYSVEDNDLWKRHIVTLVSQVTVAIYVFRKSWSGGDKRLLIAAILLFIAGTLNFVKKILVHKAASFSSMASSSAVYPRRRQARRHTDFFHFCFGTAISVEDAISLRYEEEHDLSLQVYIEQAKGLVEASEKQRATVGTEQQGDTVVIQVVPNESIHSTAGTEQQGGTVGTELPGATVGTEQRGVTVGTELPGATVGTEQRGVTVGTEQQEEESIHSAVGTEKRFVDLSAPYSRRLRDMSSFLKLKDVEYTLQEQLGFSFGMIYTSVMGIFSISGWFLICFIPSTSVASAVLFALSHKGGYKESDVKVTHILLWCTAALEVLSIPTVLIDSIIWSVTAAQHNLVSFVARRSMPTKLMRVSALGWLKEYINEHWYIRQESSSACHAVIQSVIEHLKDGWSDFILDAESYKRFNNFRGQWTMSRLGVSNPQLLSSLQVPFDQSVLVWHLATEFCLRRSNTTSPPPTNNEAQVTSPRTCSKVISDYMIYLLLIRPEMLMLGSRSALFTTTCDDIVSILKSVDEPPSQDERTVVQGLYDLHAERHPENIGPQIFDAILLALKLEMLDDEERWKVIQGVWVEMLCYSAGRCRGYLHVKSMGEGVEFLSYIWLILLYMGMETCADKLQREGEEGVSRARMAPPSPTDNRDTRRRFSI